MFTCPLGIAGAGVFLGSMIFSGNVLAGFETAGFTSEIFGFTVFSATARIVFSFAALSSAFFGVFAEEGCVFSADVEAFDWELFLRSAMTAGESA